MRFAFRLSAVHLSQRIRVKQVADSVTEVALPTVDLQRECYFGGRKFQITRRVGDDAWRSDGFPFQDDLPITTNKHEASRANQVDDRYSFLRYSTAKARPRPSAE